MKLMQYNKAIVAVVWAFIATWQMLAPGTAPDVTGDQVANWVALAMNLLGPVLIYAVPNVKAT